MSSGGSRYEVDQAVSMISSLFQVQRDRCDQQSSRIELFSETRGSYWLSWSHHCESFTVATLTWLSATEYLCHKWPRISSRFVTRVTWQMPIVEGELLILPEHLRSLQVFSGVRVTRSLVLCIVFCGSLFVLFLFDHCVVCPSIYGFWPLFF